MKKIGKNILLMIIGGIIFSVVSVYAAISISADNITLSSSKTTKTNVKDALDELYTKVKNPICKRATELHNDGTHTFGSLGTTGTLTSGDAFDCDVDGTGYNHRFYFVSYKYIGGTTGNEAFDTNTATLIYYNNVSGGTASNSIQYAYNDDTNKINYNGPITAVQQLPKTTQWPRLKSTKRTILNEIGGNYNIYNSTNYELPGNGKAAFDYSNYAARLLTYQEVVNACGSGTVTSKGYIDTCQYLMENTKFSNSSIGTYGYWLETPRSFNSTTAWSVDGHYRIADDINANYASDYGVRPAIDVSISDIQY